MNKKVFVVINVLFIIIYFISLFIDLRAYEKYYLLNSTTMEYELMRCVISILFAGLISFLWEKGPLVFRLLCFLLLFPLIYIFNVFFVKDAFADLDFVLSKNRKIEKIDSNMENGWRLNKIITEKKDTFYLSENPNWNTLIPLEELKKIKIKESITNPHKYYYYFND